MQSHYFLAHSTAVDIVRNNKACVKFQFPFLYMNRLRVFANLNLDKDLHYTSACFTAYRTCFGHSHGDFSTIDTHTEMPTGHENMRLSRCFANYTFVLLLYDPSIGVRLFNFITAVAIKEFSVRCREYAS